MSGDIHAVAIPKWGIEMVEGTVSSWNASVGATLSKGDELVDIESDKIVNVLEAPASGVLRRVLANEGDALGVGVLIGVIAEANVDDEQIDAFIASYEVPKHSASASTTSAAPAAAAPAATPPSPARSGGRVSPVVKRRARELGVDIATVKGTGRNGRITADDVEKAAAGGGADAAPVVAQDNPVTVTAMTSTQQTIARRLVESKQSVPHFYLSADIEMDALWARRGALNDAGGQNVSVNDLIVWCVARALCAVPQMNAQLNGDDIHTFEHADVSVAVATERGLITPIVRSADLLSPQEIAARTSDLIDRARAGKLARDEIDGGTFTVSNLGMFGVDRFDAIINPPQVAILALGQVRQTVVVRDSGETVVARCVSANLSCDHRVVDGALGGRFLSALKKIVEQID